MPVVTIYGQEYSCDRAMKGEDFVRLVDSDGNITFFADGITDFTGYTITDGSWETPVAVIAPTVGATATLSGGNLVLTLPAGVKAETDLQINFKAPCNCSNVTGGLSIAGQIYTIVDTQMNPVSGKIGAWSLGSVISVILDSDNKKAYLQNIAGSVPLFIGMRNKKYRVATFHRGSGSSSAGEIRFNITNGGQYGDSSEIKWSISCTGSVTEKIVGYVSIYIPILYVYRDSETVSSETEFSVYISFPNYCDNNRVYSEFSLNTVLEQTDVTDTWDTEIAGKYLTSSSPNRSRGTGIYFNGYNLMDKAQIVTGSYTGTGTSGSSNPCSLTFDFTPQFVMIYGQGYTQSDNIPLIRGCTEVSVPYSNGANFGFGVTWGTNTVSWYSGSAGGQANSSGFTYYYVAIG